MYYCSREGKLCVYSETVDTLNLGWFGSDGAIHHLARFVDLCSFNNMLNPEAMSSLLGGRSLAVFTQPQSQIEQKCVIFSLKFLDPGAVDWRSGFGICVGVC